MADAAGDVGVAVALLPPCGPIATELELVIMVENHLDGELTHDTYGNDYRFGFDGL